MTKQRYSRFLAVSYALRYGRNPNPAYPYFKVYGDDGGDCTNFISQCLYAGGSPMVFTGPKQWWYKNKNDMSISWTLAHSLYIFLKESYRLNLNGPQAVEINNVNHLEAGDLIFYENFEGRINHAAIVTGFYYGKPLITQHTHDLVNISYIKKNKSKMHFMKMISNYR